MKCSGIAALLLILIAIPATAQIDPSTGLPVEEYQTEVGPYDSGPILWDTTHGVVNGYEPSGQFSDLAGLLIGSGSSITVWNQGILNIDLSQYCVLVICGGSADNTPYTSAEVAAIVTYVDQGGGLLVLADNPATPSATNLNPVTQAFGTSVALSHALPGDLYFTDFAAHEIFAGIGEIFYRAAGVIQGGPPSVEAAWSGSAEAMITVVNPHSVVITGDWNFCTDSYIYRADNQAFILNVFDWLCTGTVATEAVRWGDVKAQFR